MKLLTSEIKEFIYNRPWPGGNRLVFDVDEVMEPMPHLAFILYRDNFNTFTGEEQMQIAMAMKEIGEKIRDSGIPTTLEVKANVRSQ